MSQSVFFAHANGFPSATYAKLFEALAPEYRVDHLEMHGHDPRFPVNDNWDNLVDELLHHLASLEQPVWGVGHSLGGVLHYHAALRRPELYRGVVMLDSPVLTLADRLVIRAAKRFGFIDRITPAGRTLGRREAFPDLEEARAYFSGKALFRRFDPDCLEAYVRHGLADSGGGSGLRLRFDPATEISIYRSVPHSSPGRAHHQGDIGTGADQGDGEHRRQGQQDRQFLHGYSTKKGSERKTRFSAGAGAPAVTRRCDGTDG